MQAFPPAAPANSPQQVVQPAVAVVTEVPRIVQRVQVSQAPSRTDLLVEPEEWTWQEFRDYVVAEITQRFGAFPRDARKEYGIFSRFLSAYGSDAVRIAKYAFGPTCDGWWSNAPISINRFCKGSDAYFAQPILDRLNSAQEVTDLRSS